jgi:glycolate oxidase FAD binding subunit
VDVDDQARYVLGRAGPFAPIEGPPALPSAARRSLPSGRIRDLPALAGSGRWIAEVGVGLVHCDETASAGIPAQPAAAEVVDLHRRIKERFDPTGRMNPGRSPLTAVTTVAG